MGTNERVKEIRARRKSEGGDVSGRHQRTRWSLPIFASTVSLAFVAVMVVPPTTSLPASAVVSPEGSVRDTAQALTVEGEYLTNSLTRDIYASTITDPPPPPPPPVAVRVASSAPAAGVPDPGSAKAVAYEIVASYGWGEGEYNCLVALWNRESGWNTYAHNASSGAYGIPQSLPGEKMASAGADWATNPATQIQWGLGYISGRYGTPCGAWEASETQGWY